MDILNGETTDITASLVQKPGVAESFLAGVDARVISQVELPKIIEAKYPDLTDEEREQVRQGVMTQLAITASGGLHSEDELPPDAKIIDAEGNSKPLTPKIVEKTVSSGETEKDANLAMGRQFLKLSDKFINIEDLNIDLIDSVNPFAGAYEIISKSLTAPILKTIQDEIVGSRIKMSEEEALILWPKIKAFVQENGRQPSITSSDALEQRFAEAVAFLKRKKREREASAAQA